MNVDSLLINRGINALINSYGNPAYSRLDEEYLFIFNAPFGPYIGVTIELAACAFKGEQVFVSHQTP